MNAIFTALKAFAEMLSNLVGMGFWLIRGIGMISDLLHAALFVIGEALDFLPDVVASGILGVCGGLVVLRIFGRS